MERQNGGGEGIRFSFHVVLEDTVPHMRICRSAVFNLVSNTGKFDEHGTI
jgi:hypothetical protein